MGERLYLADDSELGIEGHRDAAVRERHIQRYERALEDIGPIEGAWADLACGSGYGTEILAERGSARWVYGVDQSDDAILYAMRNHAHTSDGDPICYLRMSVVAAPIAIKALESAPIDAIVSIETLEHLPKNTQGTFLANCAHSLHKRHGVLILSCALSHTDSDDSNPFHLHEPEPDEIIQHLDSLFTGVSSDMQPYESTYGPALQGWFVARGPK